MRSGPTTIRSSGMQPGSTGRSGTSGTLLRSSGAEPTAIARALGLPAAAVQGPASFFSDFSAQRGARHVRVCTAAACYAATAGAHVAEVEAALGVETGRRTADGSVSIQAVRCLGYCFAGPAALDGDQACAGADLAAQLRGESAPKAPPIPVHNDSPFPVVTAGLLGTAQPWSVWPGVVASAAPGDVLVQVASARLRGRGGAGFSSAAKWRAALEHPGPRVVVVNGDEGDPGSYADRLLMERDPHRVLEGMALAASPRAPPRLVYVRSEYPRAPRRPAGGRAEARAAGISASTPRGPALFDIRGVRGRRVLCRRRGDRPAESIEGLRGVVRPRPPSPPSGLPAGRPWSTTSRRSRRAMDRAARRRGIRPLGTADEHGTKVVCLNERFGRPGAYEVELGTPVRQIVEELGGGLRDGAACDRLQVGGPLGGFLGPDDLDVPLALPPSRAGRRPRPRRHRRLRRAPHRRPRCCGTSGGSPRPRAAALRALPGRPGAAVLWRSRPGRIRDVAAERGRGAADVARGSLCAFGRRVPAAVRSLARVYELGGMAT